MRMRVAFFNWRDMRHPMAGGAELYVHELLSRLAGRGHEAALFTSSYRGAPARETIDGIEHIRYGGRITIYPNAPLAYRRHIRGRFDLIVESINGVPFFTPLFAKEKVVPLVHQLTRENWYSALPWPVAFAGYHSEDLLLRLYSGLTAIAPSPSTKTDLSRLGFSDVRIIYGSSNLTRPRRAAKEKTPTLLYLGRLTKSKRVSHAIEAFSLLLRKVPRAMLWVAGSGPEQGQLASLARSLGISSRVRFFGRVTEREKATLLSKAHIVLFPAVREGWGLVVLEANACGTPVLGYDVLGLRDSVQNGVNGALVRDGDAEALAGKACDMLSDTEGLGRLSESSLAYSKRFSWDRSADALEELLEGLLSR